MGQGVSLLQSPSPAAAPQGRARRSGRQPIGRILKRPTRADCKSAGLCLRGFESLSAHCEESHVVVPARNERHNHAAFGGLRASRTKRCEPTRSGAVTLFVPLWGRCASLFASLFGARHAPGLARRCRRGGALLPRCRQRLRCPRNRNPPTDKQAVDEARSRNCHAGTAIGVEAWWRSNNINPTKRGSWFA